MDLLVSRIPLFRTAPQTPDVTGFRCTLYSKLFIQSYLRSQMCLLFGGPSLYCSFIIFHTVLYNVLIRILCIFKSISFCKCTNLCRAVSRKRRYLYLYWDTCLEVSALCDSERRRGHMILSGHPSDVAFCLCVSQAPGAAGSNRGRGGD